MLSIQKFHCGNLTRERFRDIIKSDRYWEVNEVSGKRSMSTQPKDCGENCLQNSQQYLARAYVKGNATFRPRQLRLIWGFCK